MKISSHKLLATLLMSQLGLAHFSILAKEGGDFQSFKNPLTYINSSQSAQREIRLICKGEGHYNGEPLDAKQGVNLIILKESETLVSYSFFGRGFLPMTIEGNRYYNFIVNGDKVKEHFSLNRTTLEFSWIARLETDMISLDGVCSIPKINPAL